MLLGLVGFPSPLLILYLNGPTCYVLLASLKGRNPVLNDLILRYNPYETQLDQYGFSPTYMVMTFYYYPLVTELPRDLHLMGVWHVLIGPGSLLHVLLWVDFLFFLPCSSSSFCLIMVFLLNHSNLIIFPTP